MEEIDKSITINDLLINDLLEEYSAYILYTTDIIKAGTKHHKFDLPKFESNREYVDHFIQNGYFNNVLLYIIKDDNNTIRPTRIH